MTEPITGMPDSMTGSCMCGAVQYRISEKPLMEGLCHCNQCRPQSGSAFSTIIIIKRSSFESTGEIMEFEDVGASGKRVLRGSCARCGSPVTTKSEIAPEIMFVKAGGIHSNEWFHPQFELFVGRRRPWVRPVPAATQFEANPPI